MNLHLVPNPFLHTKVLYFLYVIINHKNALVLGKQCSKNITLCIFKMRNYLPFWFITVEQIFSSNVFLWIKMIKVYGIRPNQTVLEKCEVVMVIKTIVYHFLYIIFNKATQTHATDLWKWFGEFYSLSCVGIVL